MPGKSINDRQVRLYMSIRRQHTQQTAAAKAGISVRSARRVEQTTELPSQRREPRGYRTRPNPFEPVWQSEVVPLLKSLPSVQAITVLHELQRRYPGRFPDTQLRTLQRHIRQWRATEGPEKPVIFRQTPQPGVLGLSDFTVADALGVTLVGEPFAHRLYHFCLAHSRWEYVQVVGGGESYTALAEGLQNALWRLGGAPREHRTDSLSAAYKNLSREEREDFTAAYEALCRHYAMTPTRNNRGQSHENGAVESANGHFKRALEQALLLRGHRDFADRPSYQCFVQDVAAARNARRKQALEAERKHLQALPLRRTTDFTELTVTVTSSSGFTVRRVFYTVPSRLIGQRLRVHLYDDRLECFLGTTVVLTLPRGRPGGPTRRGHVINYHHLIDSLRRKPQALRGLTYRDALFPRPAYRRAWEVLEANVPLREACKTVVGLLALAHDQACEAALAARLDALLDAGQRPCLESLRQEFTPTERPLPALRVDLPQAPDYNALLEHL